MTNIICWGDELEVANLLVYFMYGHVLECYKLGDRLIFFVYAFVPCVFDATSDFTLGMTFEDISGASNEWA